MQAAQDVSVRRDVAERSILHAHVPEPRLMVMRRDSRGRNKRKKKIINKSIAKYWQNDKSRAIVQ